MSNVSKDIILAKTEKSESEGPNNYWQIKDGRIVGSKLTLSGAVKHVNSKYPKEKDPFVYWPDYRVAGKIGEIYDLFKEAGFKKVNVGELYKMSGGKLGNSKSSKELSEQVIVDNAINPLLAEDQEVLKIEKNITSSPKLQMLASAVNAMKGKKKASKSAGAKSSKKTTTKKASNSAKTTASKSAKNKSKSKSAGRSSAKKSSGRQAAKKTPTKNTKTVKVSKPNPAKMKQMAAIDEMKQVFETLMDEELAGHPVTKVITVNNLDHSKANYGRLIKKPDYDSRNLMPYVIIEDKKYVVPITANCETSDTRNKFLSFLEHVVSQSKFSNYVPEIKHSFISGCSSFKSPRKMKKQGDISVSAMSSPRREDMISEVFEEPIALMMPARTSDATPFSPIIHNYD